ncbi:MAG: tetratricopeptide repeat protein [Verrucomicrobiota bacterium]
MNQKQITRTLEEALALHKSFQHDEAERLYARVRAASPKTFDAWFLSGAMAFQRGSHLDQAIDLLQRARKLQPLSVECRLFLGMALADANRFAEAEPHLSWVLKKIPAQPEAWENLARSQQGLGKPLEAIESLKNMIAHQPTNPAAHEFLGELVAASIGFPEAEPHFREAARLQPDLAVAWSNLGLSLLEQSGRVAEGMECLEKALQLDPFLSAASSARALGLLRLYKPDEALDLYNSLLWMEPGNARIVSARNMVLNYLPGQDRQSVFESHKEFGALFPDPGFQIYFNPPEPQKKLRVGFVSPDFRNHSVAYFLKPLLQHLDPEKIETILYHCHPKQDSMTTELRALAKDWHSLAGLDDEAAAEIVRKDAPDVLIDLAGHSSMNRLPLFGKRLAPVQATYLGYPNTTGLAAISHRLVDETTDPSGEADELATEKLVRFSPCAWTWDPPANTPEPAMPDASAPITFGSFNNFLKVTDETLAAWAEILSRVPNARLILKSPYFEDPEVQSSAMERLVAAGISSERVELLGFLESAASHLGIYSRLDVALDPFPYNGTTTTCEALWMGVPVVNLVGDRHASRVGLSLLSATGHADWATDSKEAYITKAIELANDRPLRERLRHSLRGDVEKSLLRDHAGQAAKFEAAIRGAWSEWCAAQSMA